MTIKKVIESNFLSIQKQINSRAELIAVTKYVGADEIRILYNLGQRDFGENRLKSLKEKSEKLADLKDLRWHFIGHIQSKKIKEIIQIPGLVSLHSVDRVKLLNILQELRFKGEIFLQYNTSGEPQKSGFQTPKDLYDAYNQIEGSSLRCTGLMCMGPSSTSISSGEDEIIRNFRLLKELRDKLNPALKLSMGMSSDYELAIREGSSYVRIGSSLYKNLA